MIADMIAVFSVGFFCRSVFVAMASSVASSMDCELLKMGQLLALAVAFAFIRVIRVM